MRYSPRHAVLDPMDEWDGNDPISTLEDQVDRIFTRRDTRHRVQACTSKLNRRELRNNAPMRRRLISRKPQFGQLIDVTKPCNAECCYPNRDVHWTKVPGSGNAWVGFAR